MFGIRRVLFLSIVLVRVVYGKQYHGGESYAGIRNQGNTCYLNSILQSLFHVRGFRDAILENAHENEPKKRRFWQRKEIPTVEIALAGVFEALAHNVTAGTKELTKSLGVDPNIQQDAQEYLRLVLEEISSTQGISTSKYYLGQSERYIRITDHEHDKLVDQGYKGPPLETRHTEPFYDLSLDIKQGNVLQHLKTSIKELMTPQHLEGDAQWKTKQYGPRDALMGLDFIRFPPILVLHLKRFAFDFERGHVAKINAPVAFPLSNLDLSDLLHDDALKSDPPPLYRLHAVVCHLGSTGESGHYYALVDPLCDGRWLRFDDNRVTPVTVNDVIKEGLGGPGALGSAYLLQYVREDALPVLHGNNKEEANIASSFFSSPSPPTSSASAPPQHAAGD